MIQPLRTAHRRIFATLAIILPIVLITGLASRRARPVAAQAKAQPVSSTELIRQSSTLWRQHMIRTQFYENWNDPQNVNLVLEPAQHLNEPDVLLYWSVLEPQGNSLPPSALLVGPFAADKAFILPLKTERSGFLVLYSLGHGQIVDVARVEKLP